MVTMDLFKGIHYWIVLAIPPTGFCLNILLICLICIKTSKEMRVHSHILLQTCIVDLLLLGGQTIGTTSYLRMDNMIVIYFAGYFPLQFKNVFGTFGLFCLYTVHQSLFIIDIANVPVQFLYRFLLLNRNAKMTAFRYLLLLMLPTVLTILVMAYFVVHNVAYLSAGIPEKQKQIVEQAISLPNLDETYITVADELYNIFDKIWTGLIILFFICSISATIFLGWRIALFVKNNAAAAGLGANAKRLNKQLTVTLILLAVYPLMVMVAILGLTAIMVMVSSGNPEARNTATYLQIQMGPYLLIHLIPVVNPMITILTNTPYRATIFQICVWRQKKSVKTTQQQQKQHEQIGGPKTMQNNWMTQ